MYIAFTAGKNTLPLAEGLFVRFIRLRLTVDCFVVKDILLTEMSKYFNIMFNDIKTKHYNNIPEMKD